MEIIKHNISWRGPLTKRKATKTIVLHCTASKEGAAVTVESVHRLHLKNGCAGIGYNFLIYADGSVHEGRPEECVGAHCPEHNGNSHGIGICYVGGLAGNGRAKDTRTEAQKSSMHELVSILMEKYGIGLEGVHCHNEFAKKACPCFSIDTFRLEFDERQGGKGYIHKCDLK